MVSNSIRKQRCDDLLETLVKGRKCVFFTLTTADVVDYIEIRRRWRCLRHYLITHFFPDDVKYVMNYEIHPGGHGWHIHSVFNHFVPLRRLRKAFTRYGFGRVNVKPISSVGVADYLTKHCLKAYRGISRRMNSDSSCRLRLRLVNCSRGLPCLHDYRWESSRKSLLVSLIHLTSQRDSPFRLLDFRDRYLLCNLAVNMGVRLMPDLVRLYENPLSLLLFRLHNPLKVQYPTYIQDDMFPRSGDIS